jgi:hypothetical protein
MQVTFQTDGGLAAFPGLAGPVTIDTDELAAAARDEICALVRSTGFFGLSQPAAPTTGADRRTYVITVAEAGRTRTLRLAEPVADPGLARLVRALRDLSRARRGP